MSEENENLESIKSKFETDFERFASVVKDGFPGLKLSAAEHLQKELNELRVRHTGKKSPVSGAMKLIGRVAPEKRAEFGKLVQKLRGKIEGSIE